MDILERDVHKRRDLKIGRKKALSGLEAARLILADSIEAEHNRPAILKREQHGAIMRGEYFSTAADRQEFSRWLKLFRMTDFSCREAVMKGLEAILTLHKACSFLALADILKQAGKEIEQEKMDMGERLLEDTKSVTSNIKFVLAVYIVMDAVSKLLTVKLHEDVEGAYSNLSTAASIFNFYCTKDTLPLQAKKYLIKDITTGQENLLYIEERIDIALGRGWSREAYRPIVFVPDTRPLPSFREYPILDFESLHSVRNGHA